MSLATLRHGRTFRSLREHRNYRLWFVGQVVSVSGTWVQNVAQAWFIAALTHSAIALGVLAACSYGPYFFIGLFGGAITDRLNNRTTLIFTQSALMVSAAVLAVLTLSGVATAWEVYLLAAINGTVQVVDTPARQSFTIEMVGRDELPNAVALNSSLFNMSRLVGPAIGGLVIASVGVGVCFALNSLSFLAVLGALLAMHADELHVPRRSREHISILRSTGEGVAYVWRTPLTRVVVGMMLFIAFFSMNFNVLLPILTQQTLHGGPAIFGWLSAAFGGGALLGALTSATLGRASSKVLLAGASLFGLAQLLLAPQNSVAVCAGLLLVTGTAFSLYTSMSNATIQMEVPDRLRGRLMAIYGYVFFGTAPLGGLLCGWLAQTGGTRLAFLVSGAVSVGIASLGVLRLRSISVPAALAVTAATDVEATRE